MCSFEEAPLRRGAGVRLQLSLARSAEALVQTLSNLNGRASREQAVVLDLGAGEHGAGLAADGRHLGVWTVWSALTQWRDINLV